MKASHLNNLLQLRLIRIRVPIAIFPIVLRHEPSQGCPVQEQPHGGAGGALGGTGTGSRDSGPNAILVRSRGRRSALRAAPSLTCRGRPQQGGEQDGGHRQRPERGALSPGPPPAPRSPARGQGLHPHAAAGRASAPKVVTWRAPTRRRKLADGGPEGRTDGHAAASARAVCGRCASLGAGLGVQGRQGMSIRKGLLCL